eukprot:2755054-Heterocapsa_arctica.AAC.1
MCVVLRRRLWPSCRGREVLVKPLEAEQGGRGHQVRAALLREALHAHRCGVERVEGGDLGRRP